MIGALLHGKGDGPKRARQRLRQQVAAVLALVEVLSRLSHHYRPLPLSLRGGEFRGIFDRRLAELLAKESAGAATLLRRGLVSPSAHRAHRADHGTPSSPGVEALRPAMSPGAEAGCCAPAGLADAGAGGPAREAQPQAEITGGDRRDTPWPVSRADARARDNVALRRQERSEQILRGVALIKRLLAAYWNSRVQQDTTAASLGDGPSHPFWAGAHDLRPDVVHDAHAGREFPSPAAKASPGGAQPHHPRADLTLPRSPGWTDDWAAPLRDFVPHSPGEGPRLESDYDLSDRIADILYRQALQHGIDVT